MQRTFFISFILLAFVNISFWTIQFQNESALCQPEVSKKEVFPKQYTTLCNGVELNVSETHSFPFKKIVSFSNAPFENEDEDKYELENESLIDSDFCSLGTFIQYNPLSVNRVSSYERFFFKLHFLDIFSPPPNC